MSEKKTIYDLNIDEMRALLIKFSKTLYGRTIFLLAYFLPFMAFLAAIGLFIASFFTTEYNLFWPILGTLLLFIFLFIIGNIYYYYELRRFVEKH